jgi:drug/metabolite transporter (DMT)-like permease
VGLLDRFGPEAGQLAVVCIWASTFVITKAAFAAISPLAFVFVRFALMTALAFGVMLARRRGTERAIRRADLPRFALVGLCGYTFYQLAFVLGLNNTSPFSSSLLVSLVPLISVMVLALRGERTPARGWAGIGVAVAGVAIFLAEKRGEGAGSLVGDALSLGAAASFALYGIAARPFGGSETTEIYTAYTIAAGSVPLLVITAPAALATDWAALPLSVWLVIVYMVVFTVYVAYMIWNWAIARRGVAAASSFSLLVPVLGGVFAAIFYDEGFGLLKLLGAALVLAGLMMIRARPKAAEAVESRDPESDA